MFDSLDWLFPTTIVALLISVPLAIWKVVDIVVWIFSNIKLCVA